MSASRDPFDILREHNPAPTVRQPDARTAEARRLLESIVAVRRPGPVRRRLRPAVAVAVAAALISAAAWAVLVRDVTEVSGVVCHQDVSLDGHRVVLRSTDEPTIAACTRAWRDGSLVSPSVAPGDVPPLTGCVNDEGTLVVFPTDDPDICDKLGLATESNQPPAGRDVLIDLQNRLVDYFSVSGCADMAAAERHVAAVLDDLGLADWTVDVHPETPERPCASFGIDAENLTIVLMPIPPPPG